MWKQQAPRRCCRRCCRARKRRDTRGCAHLLASKGVSWRLAAGPRRRLVLELGAPCRLTIPVALLWEACTQHRECEYQSTGNARTRALGQPCTPFWLERPRDTGPSGRGLISTVPCAKLQRSPKRQPSGDVNLGGTAVWHTGVRPNGTLRWQAVRTHRVQSTVFAFVSVPRNTISQRFVELCVYLNRAPACHPPRMGRLTGRWRHQRTHCDVRDADAPLRGRLAHY
jgi:hypothetical protein